MAQRSDFTRGATIACAALLLASGCQHGASVEVSSAAPPTAAEAVSAPTEAPDPARYVFGWGELPAEQASPRGGTSRGAPVTLAEAQPLPLPEIESAASNFERDRAAILALAGDYKVSFHFLQTLSFTDPGEAARPYHSWATEQVRVLEDRGRFISLQHTLVMFFKGEDRSVVGPMITKHWRQDWTYEPEEMHTFRGDNTWARQTVSEDEARGAWSQAVFQVDDSPRYAALGRWTHDGNRFMWTGENTWRPLPRREHTVRDDYGVMEGFHRIVLTPTGWLHEQLNWKRVAGGNGSEEESARYVGEEWGLDRYERITEPDLGAADDYWRKTGPYWRAVREAWSDVFEANDRFTLRRQVDGSRLFEEHFAYAGKLEEGAAFDPADAARHARETIAKFVVQE